MIENVPLPPRLLEIIERLERLALLHPQAPEKILLTADETAAAMGVSRKHLYNLARRGVGIPVVHLGSRTLYDKRDVLRWIDAQKRPAGPQDESAQPKSA